jgi:gp16 family phage-associated protein
MIKSANQVKHDFERSGASIAQWAITNGFNPNLVYQVLRGKSKALRGQAHDIAVRLRIKRGVEGSGGRLAA